MRITSLAENTSARGLPAEHGLSLYVDMGKCRFLFDMGQTDLFARNARALGIDLGAVDFAVLSHGHYDHGGGMAAFFALNDRAPVYVSRRAFEPYYHGPEKYIGLDARLRASERIVPVDDRLRISEGMTLINGSQVPSEEDFGGSGLGVLRDGALRDDDFLHEQYLLVETGGRRVLFSGCSHRGIVNIARRFRPDVLIGGFHLSHCPLDERLAQTARTLDALGTAYYTCHCTGAAQYEYMKGFMRSLHYLSGGDSVDVM